jgi:hypothetical protein
VLLILVSHRSSSFLRVIRPIDFVSQLTARLNAGSLVSCHKFLSLHLCFYDRSRPGISLFMSESVTLMVVSLFSDAIEAVKSLTVLTASTLELI